MEKVVYRGRVRFYMYLFIICIVNFMYMWYFIYYKVYFFLDLDLNNEFFKMIVVLCVRLRNVNEVFDFN